MASELVWSPGGQSVILTPRLWLCGASHGDAEHLFKSCFRDPETMRYWDSLPHQNVATTEKWVQSMMDSASDGVTDFVISLRKSHAVIGKVGVWKGEELGFMLGRKYWGQGLMKEALDAILSYCFHAQSNTETDYERHDEMIEARRKRLAELPCSRVVVDVDPRNTACIGLLTRFGFETTGYKAKSMRVGENWVDSVYLELTRERYLQRRGSDESVKRELS